MEIFDKKQEMTSRERVLTALNHRSTDRVPFSLGFGVNAPARRKLADYLGLHGLDAVDEYLEGFRDIKSVDADYVGPSERNIVDPSGTNIDIWGVGRKQVSYGEGYYEEISKHPLANVEDIKQLNDYQWPGVDWSDTSSIKEKIKWINRGKQYAIIVGNGNIYESSWYMRGFEQMFMDLIVNPELAWEIMTRVTDYFVTYFTKILQSADGLIDIVFTADDIGHQQGLLMSMDMWERMIKPHHVRMNKVLHEYGVKIMYHSDGAVMEAVPGLLDMGIDILEALQFDAKGMDPKILKEQYGDRLCFHGGVSVQSTLPFGTTDDVKLEVKERIQVLGKNGGYILAPSHAIQTGTPPENIAAFLEASRESH